MNPNLRKEIRIVLPIVVVSLLAIFGAGLVSVSAWFYTDNDLREAMWTVANVCFFFGCLLVAVRPFCAEFQHGTMTLLLVQPLSRLESWEAKRRVQFYSLLLLTLVCSVSWLNFFIFRRGILQVEEFVKEWNRNPWDSLFFLSIPLSIPVLAYFTGPLWALLVRGTLAAATLAVAGPFLAAAPFLIWTAWTGKEPSPWISSVAVLCYPVGCHHLARRIYFRMQLTGGQTGNIDLLMLEKIFQRLVPVRVQLERQPQSGSWALFKKELCLQQTPMLLCLVMLFLFAIMLLSDAVFSSSGPIQTLSDDYLAKYGALFGFYVFLVPFISGCVAMSEERASGIHSWQIILPVSRRRQWLLKLAGLFSVNIVLTMLIPGLLLLLFPHVRDYLLNPNATVWRHLQFFGFFFTVNAGLAIVSFYIASLFRNTITAILSSLGAVVYLLAAFLWIPHFVLMASPHSFTNVEALLSIVAPILIAAVLLSLSLANFSHAEMSHTRRFRQMVGVGSFTVALVFVLSGIFWIVG